VFKHRCINAAVRRNSAATSLKGTKMATPAFQTREQYLLAAIEQIRPVFKQNSETIPPVKVSVGFPGGGSARKRIGEHWHPKATADGISQIFISPVLADPIQALDTLVHELVHACRPDAGHKAPFKRLGESVGLTGKPKNMSAGPALLERLKAISVKLGPYPHAGISLIDKKKQTTRLLKASCPCGYTVRVTRTWIEASGAPLCPCEYDGPRRYRRMDIDGLQDDV
jgi:hypothetical protein